MFASRLTRLARALPLVVMATLLATVTPPRAAQALPAGFSDTLVFENLELPTALAFAPDGRIFVAEKAGIVKVFDSLDDPTPSVFADFRARVDSRGDKGLLGIAVDPAKPSVPWVHVLYTRKASLPGTDPLTSSARLSRIPGSGGVEDVLIDDWCTSSVTHSIGTVAFSDSGALYVGGGDGAGVHTDYGQEPAGDGGGQNPCADPPSNTAGEVMTLAPDHVAPRPDAEGGALKSQDLRTPDDPLTLSGTIIRVDPDTGEPWPGNPLSGASDGNVQRVVAMGLRNPFRFTVRPGTEELWVAEVGRFGFEEINVVPEPAAGVVPNFGWPCYEGPLKQGTFDRLDLDLCEDLYHETDPSRRAIPPVFAYAHEVTREDPSLNLYRDVVPGDGCARGNGDSPSATAFYTGGSYPSRYHNAFFFGDYSRQCVWVMLPGADGLPDPSDRELVSNEVGAIVDLKTGPGGDLFYVDLARGQVRRLSYTTGEQPPIAVATATPRSGGVPLTVSFDGRGSSSPAGGTLTYAWDLDGDGAFDDATTPTVQHTYSSPGEVRAGLRVTDARNLSATTFVTIRADRSPPEVTITSPAPGATWAANEPISFSGTAKRDGVNLPASALTWSIVLHHCTSQNSTNCHVHPLETFTGVRNGSFSAPEHEWPSWLELRLTAADADGSAEVTREIHPRAVDVTITSKPTGLRFSIGDEEIVTPSTQRLIVGSTLLLSAPEQVAGGLHLEGWSHGGPATQLITVDERTTTFTAVYGSGTSETSSPPFNDIAGTTHASAIARLSALGVTGGYPDGSYRPDLPVNRAQMATFLTRAFALPGAGDHGFRDVLDPTHRASINAIAAAGITKGCDSSRYCPGDPVTRAQMASFLARALQLPPASAAFRDVPSGAPHADSIGAVQAAGITQGCDAAGSFCPQRPVTRGQMASFLVRSLE